MVDDEWKCSDELGIAMNPDGNLVNYVQVFENENTDNIDCQGMSANLLGYKTGHQKIYKL